jgi:hypothetical protein
VQLLGRFLQLLGLVVVPMALFYYFDKREIASESTLMFGELMILACGALAFGLGTFLLRKG